MPNVIKAAEVVEEGVAFLEKNPGFISRMAEIAAANWGKVGLTGMALALAGCSKKPADQKPVAPRPAAALPSGADLAPDAPINPPTSPDASAPMHIGPGGVPVLEGNPAQPPQRDYPGGIGPDVNDVKNLIDRIPGPQGFQAQVLFQAFLNNHNSRVDENTIPKNLPLFDLPAKNDAERQFVTSNIDHWQLKHDVDLYVKAPQGPFGTRDLRPNTDQTPGGGKLPPMFFAVGRDKDNKPVDILEYYHDGTGDHYREQYQFKYDKLADGRQRVTIFNWMDSSLTPDVGPRQVIGSRLNTLEGVTQYYYDGTTGKCTEALYFNGYTFNQPRQDQYGNDNWKPWTDIKFSDSQVSVSNRLAGSGRMSPVQTYTGMDAQNIVRAKAGTLNFYNLLGPTLPDLPNGG